ncbi:MAG TPA: aminotransferase class V-fold PLP-dependent enzyme [Pseudonocardiaceae bacterium]|jgi:selenocysteine lyase/cysteine desulfurase|nr:aminotransferase class V-fold PLP-dependent enzyme [Pseudonocardiaceae bacterium]
MTLALPIQTRTDTRLPAVVGATLTVPLVTGRTIGYANLDHAASAPCLADVKDAVDELLPWYASVHRGAGFASQVCTRIYEQARDTVREFVGAHSTDAVIFTRNTTDSLNLLASALPARTSVVLFDSEHHAALLPWRGLNVRRLTVPASPGAAVAAVASALQGCPTGPRLVVVTGASNVTGELWPIAELADVAHRHGARIVVDAAQLAPHRPIDLRTCGADYLVFSGHKLYAPFGAGVLVGRTDWLRAAPPYLRGGGATALVSEVGVEWSQVPDRHEAGSPNVVGVHALAAACTALRRDFDTIRAHERTLASRLFAGLRTVPGLRELSVFGAGSARVGVASFTIDGLDPGLVAAVLSAEHGIGVRDGAFCAHIVTRRLLAANGTGGQRALRASIGIGTTAEHVQRLVSALRELVTAGPRWTYRQHDGRWTPTPDPRPLPPFLAG